MKPDFDTYTEGEITADGIHVRYRAFLNIPTAEHPVDPAYQCMDVFVPESCYDDSGRYDVHNAPIFFENNAGGFLASKPRTPDHETFGRTSTTVYALNHGYVVVSPGARGRDNYSREKGWYGKGSAILDDLNRAVALIQENADVFPGRADRIITVGTSAGGGLSLLQGLEKDIPVYACAAYCPVNDLEHADMAYEWQFRGIHDYHRMNMEMNEGGRPKFTPEDGMMSRAQEDYSRDLAAGFPGYVNSLNLKSPEGEALKLMPDGTGSFRNDLMKEIAASWAQESKSFPFSFESYMKKITRMKTAPAFDDVTMTNFENGLFGDEKHESAHFTNYSMEHSTVQRPIMADPNVIRRLNVVDRLIDGEKPTARHFRIRMGTLDRDIGFGSVLIMARLLAMKGADVDFHFAFGKPHDGDYDLKQLFDWIDEIV